MSVPPPALPRELLSFFELSAEGVVVTDAAGQVLYLNPAAAGLMRLAGAEVALATEALRAARFYDGLGNACPLERLPMNAALRVGEPAPVVEELGCQFHPAGERRWYIVTATPLRGDGGEVRQVISTYRDVTAERRSAQALRYLAEASAALVSSPDEDEILDTLARLAVPAIADWCSVELLRPDGSCRTVGMAHSDPTKVALIAEVRHRNPLRIDTPSGFGHVLRTGEPFVLPHISEEDLRTVIQNPEDLRLLEALGLKASLAVPLIGRGGNLGILTLTSAESGRRFGLDDLALAMELAKRTALAIEHARLYRERQRLVEELQRSNAELERFAYVASHDLQEPLRMVGSYTQLLARRYRGRLDADADEFIRHAVDGVGRMQRLITGLLSYARASTQAPELEQVSCQEILDRVLSNLQPAMAEGGARVAAEPLPSLPGDEVQLEQLFQNLVGNALKFRGERPVHVRISAQPRDGEWLFQVRDNGIGIAPENQRRIFALFQRLHSQAEFHGSGIGLATCKRIVERHGGRIWVESTPGEGSTFLFTLPARGAKS